MTFIFRLKIKMDGILAFLKTISVEHRGTSLKVYIIINLLQFMFFCLTCYLKIKKVIN
jgi:hypothetical protein